jgi:hypothetical protein
MSSYVASHHLAVTSESESVAKDQFYRTVYYSTLNSNCEAQRVSKKWKKYIENKFWSQNQCLGD